MRYNYRTNGTCSREISFDLEGNIVRNVSFVGGCNGNLKAVSALVEGATVEEINQRCGGITCGMKQTSCADQLARAVREALRKSQCD